MTFSSVIAKILAFPIRAVTSVFELVTFGEFTNITSLSHESVTGLEKTHEILFNSSQPLSGSTKFGYDFVKGLTPIVNIPGLFSGK